MSRLELLVPPPVIMLLTGLVMWMLAGLVPALGVLLILIGWAVYLGNVLSGLCALGFVAYISRFQILPEERLLQEKFGEDFLAYKSAVRRWL